MLAHVRRGWRGGILQTGKLCALGTLVPGVIALGFLVFLANSAIAEDECEASQACADALQYLLRDDKDRGSYPDSQLENAGISLSVDGEPVAGLPPVNSSIDSNVSPVDIQVKFDGLDVDRQLNISTVPERRQFLPDTPIEFYGSWNYGAWIERAEVRIYRRIDKQTPFDTAIPVAIVPMNLTGHAVWDQNDTGLEPEELAYTLRVYDREGRFDETGPLALKISREADRFPSRNNLTEPGYGEDRSFIRNIDLNGGTVTVFGQNVPEGQAVRVNGEEVPVDVYGSFVATRILPPGDHVVQVELEDPNGDIVLEYEREAHIPENEFFFVGLADVTIGKSIGSDSAVLKAVEPGEYDDVYRHGRLAFYLKGKVKGRYLITAAADTREDSLDVLFSNIDRKDPRQLLRRLDPDDYYPIYGDDSTTVEDAPTSGRFYVKIEDGKSHIMWGNYKVRINGTELARYERGLYGGGGEYVSETTTSFGEPHVQVEGFAAHPGTLPQRDVFRGTGGSIYFLQRQDLTIGSEQVSIEERDQVSGIVLDRRLLRPQLDYDFDALQGVVLLREPLASSTATSSPVRNTSTGGNPLYLIVQYEYTPTSSDLDGVSVGGRAQTWLGDHVRLGVTGFKEDNGLSDQSLLGADLVLRLSDNTYFEAEMAWSHGRAYTNSYSVNGGFIFGDTSDLTSGDPANAWRVKGVVDLADVTQGAVQGAVGGYYENAQAGFNSPVRFNHYGERIWGAFAEIGTNETGLVAGRYDEVSRGDGFRKREVSAEAVVPLNERFSLSTGVRHSMISDTALDYDNGSRTDIGARIDQRIDDSFTTWGFGQVTVARKGDRERNDRIGVGAEKDLTDQITATGEVSWGTTGIGLLAGVYYEPTASDRYHIGFRLMPEDIVDDLAGYDPFNRDYGEVVVGTTRKLSDSILLSSENNLDFMGTQRSFTHAYGVTYNPEPEWQFTAAAEAGEIRDDFGDDFNRVAVSGTVGYNDEFSSAGLRLEARFENSLVDDYLDRNTFLVVANTVIAISPDWRFLAKADAAFSQTDQESFLNGDYVETSLGFAYRPVENDRLNALLRYTYLYDLPGPDQVNINGNKGGPQQKSHIISGDVIYDLNELVSVGGKYGARFGMISSAYDSNFEYSSAHLAALRFDLHVVHNWDLMVEGRMFWLPELDQVHYGVLAGIYRHIGNNLKFGIGYNFGRFSDDLTDLTLDDSGVFVNVVGKF
ncbi:MAG: TonB-dependent receptor [Rhizobiaceae bacterium]